MISFHDRHKLILHLRDKAPVCYDYYVTRLKPSDSATIKELEASSKAARESQLKGHSPAYIRGKLCFRAQGPLRHDFLGRTPSALACTYCSIAVTSVRVHSCLLESVSSKMATINTQFCFVSCTFTPLPPCAYPPIPGSEGSFCIFNFEILKC